VTCSILPWLSARWLPVPLIYWSSVSYYSMDINHLETRYEVKYCLKMIKIDRNISELWQIVRKNIILTFLMFVGPCIVNIFQYISNKMQLYTVYLYLETALHVSSDTSTHHQKRIQLYLQHLLFVTIPLLLPAAIAAGSSNGVTNTRCCRYGCMCSWWWVEVPPEKCRAVSRWNKLCKVASCWIYIGI